MNEQNKQGYQSSEIAEYYQQDSELQEPELQILTKFQGQLGAMRLLDIGIGGGRTAQHFAPLVKEYIGIDYSEEMVQACRHKFHQSFDSASFKVMDVRDMGELESDYFDFILFSFNGLDCINHQERLMALKEIQRVSKKGGFFCFSSHNLSADIEDYYRFRIYDNLSITFKRFKWSLMFLLKNGWLNKLTQKPYTLIYDDAHFFQFRHYYIKPESQLSQLADLGFKNIRIITQSTEIKAEDFIINSVKDAWVYYLCTI